MSATLVLKSANAKLGDCSATYASIKASCPDSCALKDKGCYAQNGHVAHTVRRLDACNSSSPEETARIEASHIAAAVVSGKDTRPLRLHVAGDCRTEEAALWVSAAASQWRQPVWTYTHAWRDVPREAWGRVSVLASVDNATDGREALARGYAPARVVRELPADGRAVREADGIRWIPCPEQTGKAKSCADCQLCWRADVLHAQSAGISFGAHGPKRRSLNVVQG